MALVSLRLDSRCCTLLLAFVLFIAVNGLSQTTHRHDLSTEQEITLLHLFDSVKKIYPGMQVCWEKGILDPLQKVRVSSFTPLDSTLFRVCRKLDLECTKVGNNFFIKHKKTPISHTISPAVRVFVTDQNGNPLPRASITLKSTNQMTITQNDGTAILLPGNIQDSIKVSFIGMSIEERMLPKEGFIHVYMHYEQPNPMNEAISTGYGTGSKATYTGDRSMLSASQLDFPGGVTLQTAVSGQIPGVLATQSSGIPGSSVYYSLRGPISLANGRDPLYIIDNVPFGPGNQSLSNISSGSAASSLSPFSFISLSDIERIEVLKDADATAIYGSRGANGVILIFTKKGRSGKPHFDIRVASGLTGVSRRPRLLNNHQYTAMRLEAFQNDKRTLDSTNAADLIKWDTTRYTDWGKYLLGDLAPATDLQLALSGGNRHTNYFTGLNAERQTNIFPTHPTHDLINLLGNVGYHSENGKLRAEFSGLLGGDWNHQPIEDPTKFQFLAPDAPALTDKAGNLVFQANGLSFGNPLAFLRRSYEARSSVALFDGSINYQLLPTLSFNINIGYNRVQTHEYSNLPAQSQDPANNPMVSDDFAHTAYASSILEPQLEYTRKCGNIMLRLMGGVTTQFESNTILLVSDSGYLNNDSSRNQPPVQVLTSSHSMNYRYQAFFARLNLNYENKYVLNLTGRRDGSDRLGPYERFGNFGAFGAAWIFSREKFIEHAAKWLNFGKLRTSYGTTGNDQIGDHFLQTWAPTSVSLYQNIPGYYEPSQVSSGHTWETIHKLEVALEAGFLKDRVTFSACWYRNRSSNQLLPDSLPTAGPFLMFHNWPAILENKGWEFSLQAKIINKKKLQWTTSFNWSFPVNRLIAFPGLQTSPYAKHFIVGKSSSVVQAYPFTGVNDSTGIFQFRMSPGNAHLNDSDKKVVGNFGSTSFGGLTNSFRWKNVQVEFLIDGRFQTGSNYQVVFYTDNPPGSLRTVYSNETKDILDHWRQPGDHARYQKLTTLLSSDPGKAIGNYIGSSAILTNASFIRLRKVSLTYRFPQRLLDKSKLSEIRLFINAFNLLTISPYKGIDPELQNAQVFPTLRTVETGVHVAL